MKKFVPLAIAASLMILGASSAEAGWKRNGTATGPNGGVWTSSGAGSCAHGVCSSNQTVTGPYGGTTVRSGSAVCNGAGTCSGNATITGPAGRKFKRSGTVTVQ